MGIGKRSPVWPRSPIRNHQHPLRSVTYLGREIRVSTKLDGYRLDVLVEDQDLMRGCAHPITIAVSSTGGRFEVRVVANPMSPFGVMKGKKRALLDALNELAAEISEFVLPNDPFFGALKGNQPSTS
jgi:hypothetical protein